MDFGNLGELLASTIEAVRPSERLTVPQTAAKYRRLNNRGSYVGPWKNETTPYLVEPMSVLTSLRYTGMIFVGPAQCGKTDMFQNWVAHTAKVDGADIMLVQTSQTTAQDFSKRRIDRLHRDSPAIGECRLPGKNFDNVFDKRYRNGSMLTLSWPTVNELSGKPIPRVYLTDYDRMSQDVDGNGSPYDLAAARTTSFRRHGMTVAESSPSFPIMDPRWSPLTPHEAPPCEGILALYNRGDRQRWYWPCYECGHPFEPDFKLLDWPNSADKLECAEQAVMKCPHCQAEYKHAGGNGRPSKFELNLIGTWLRDGETLTPDGEIVGTPARSDIASFWLKGVAAAFKDWKTLVLKYLSATEEYERTASEDALKTTVNVDQGAAYLPKALESDRVPEMLRDQARDYGHKVVPFGVRFLVAAIDVQKHRFVVQVMGIGVNGNIWIVDRFDIKYSRRRDEESDVDGQFHRVRPFTYKEDWRVLLDEVLLRSYPLVDGSGRRMAIKSVVSDSGGQDEGTANAYEFWRWLKNGPGDADLDRDEWSEKWVPGLHARFQLLKGASGFDAPRVRLTYPDSQRKDRTAGARGEIPVLMINTRLLKNLADAVLDRERETAGSIHFPRWLEINFYKELCVETKDLKGNWINPKKFRNESWDLLVYGLAILQEPRHINIERIDWADPPVWAQDWDENVLVFKENEAQPFAVEKKGKYDLQQLGQLLG